MQAIDEKVKTLFGRQIAYDPSLSYIKAIHFQEGLEFRDTTAEQLLEEIAQQTDVKTACLYSAGNASNLNNILGIDQLWRDVFSVQASSLPRSEDETTKGIKNSLALYATVTLALRQ